MDKIEYLQRIQFPRTAVPDPECLVLLHQYHLYHVPFENLDIQAGKQLSLDLGDLYHKIVRNRRGGFCYELNSLFHWLLTEIGFTGWMISARVINDAGEPGPEFDHMALILEADQKYLVDVGFGDLFLKPLKLNFEDIQPDGNAYFKIQREGEKDYSLLMSTDGMVFRKEYVFNLEARILNDFEAICLDKQINPASHFVQNRICTKPTLEGRWTIRNNQWIETLHHNKSGFIIENQDQYKQLLLDKFGMVI